jgi:hypothetical protein
VCVCVQACMYEYIYECMYVFKHACMNIYMNACMCLCMHVFMYVIMCMYVFDPQCGIVCADRHSHSHTRHTHPHSHTRGTYSKATRISFFSTRILFRSQTKRQTQQDNPEFMTKWMECMYVSIRKCVHENTSVCKRT